MNRELFLSGTLAVAAVLFATPAAGTPATGFTAVQTIKGTYPELKVKGEKTGKWDVKIDTKDDSDIYVVRNAIAAGRGAGTCIRGPA